VHDASSFCYSQSGRGEIKRERDKIALLNATPHAFSPTLIEPLERQEHLHLKEEFRSQLLSLSTATANRLLSSQGKRGQRVLSTTHEGTLLK
jgi:hypothetical protein